MYGIYIHYPFCVHKCYYCDFYSIEDLKLRDKFVDYLLNEIDLRFEGTNKSDINADTVFFGGGTPSLLKPEHLDRIVSKLQQKITFDANTEWTLECNPGTIDTKYMEDFKSIGINRISFGVQSFNPDELKFLERIHSPKQVYKSIDTARNAGFENISIDLMFALPNQTMETWDHTLGEAIALDIEHISSYSLIYEPGTPLFNQYEAGKVKVIEEDMDTKFYYHAINKLNKAGFTQYEVSNFHKNGNICKHNLKYWHGEEYFAFGPSAHGYLNGRRYWNFRSNETYFKLLKEDKLPEEGSEILTEYEKMFERIYLELRADGLRVEKFKNDFGINLLEISERNLSMFESKELVSKSSSCIKLTANGYFLGDDITLKIIDDLEKHLGIEWRKD